MPTALKKKLPPILGITLKTKWNSISRIGKFFRSSQTNEVVSAVDDVKGNEMQDEMAASKPDRGDLASTTDQHGGAKTTASGTAGMTKEFAHQMNALLDRHESFHLVIAYIKKLELQRGAATIALQSCEYEIFACLRDDRVKAASDVLSALQTAYDITGVALAKLKK